MGGNRWEKSKQNGSDSSNNYARPKSNKRVEIDEAAAI